MDPLSSATNPTLTSTTPTTRIGDIPPDPVVQNRFPGHTADRPTCRRPLSNSEVRRFLGRRLPVRPGAGLNEPAGHGVAVELTQYDPAGHGYPLSSATVWGVADVHPCRQMYPGVHVLHCRRCGSAPNVPIGHVTHAWPTDDRGPAVDGFDAIPSGHSA